MPPLILSGCWGERALLGRAGHRYGIPGRWTTEAEERASCSVGEILDIHVGGGRVASLEELLSVDHEL